MKNVIEHILENLCPVDLCDDWEELSFEKDTVNCLPETEKCAKCWADVDKKLQEQSVNDKANKVLDDMPDWQRDYADMLIGGADENI